MTNHDLIESILESPARRKAVEFLIEMMLDHESLGKPHVRYEITVRGRQVSSAFYQHCRTETLPPPAERLGGTVPQCATNGKAALERP